MTRLMLCFVVIASLLVAGCASGGEEPISQDGTAKPAAEGSSDGATPVSGTDRPTD